MRAEVGEDSVTHEMQTDSLHGLNTNGPRPGLLSLQLTHEVFGEELARKLEVL